MFFVAQELAHTRQELLETAIGVRRLVHHQHLEQDLHKWLTDTTERRVSPEILALAWYVVRAMIMTISPVGGRAHLCYTLLLWRLAGSQSHGNLTKKRNYH